LHFTSDPKFLNFTKNLILLKFGRNQDLNKTKQWSVLVTRNLGAKTERNIIGLQKVLYRFLEANKVLEAEMIFDQLQGFCRRRYELKCVIPNVIRTGLFSSQ
jgi:hypothetical protein